MKISKKKMIVVLLIILLGALGIYGYFWYQGEYFVSTIDARIDADMVNITPMQSGRLVAWEGYEGQYVSQNDKLGIVDAGSAVSSIYAPINGKIVQVNVKEGQAVSLGQAAAVIADYDNIYISANIEETKIARLKLGQGVEIRLDAYPGKLYFGKVTQIGEAATSVFSMISSSSSNGNYTKITQLIPVKIAFAEEYDEDFKLGMNVDYITAGAAVASVADISQLILKGNIAENAVSQISLGDKVKVKVDPLGKTFDGVVTFISQISVASGQMFPIEITVNNENEEIKAGMSASAAITP